MLYPNPIDIYAFIFNIDKIRIYIISHYLGIFAYGNFTKVLRRFYIIFYFNDNAQTGCAVSS